MNEREILARLDTLFPNCPLPSPRVLARITEEDTQTYHLHCEHGWCAQLPAENVYESLETAAHDARSHAVSWGHAVLVEAL